MERRFRKPSAVGLRILCFFAKLDAISVKMLVHSLYITGARAEGYWSAVVQDCGVGLFVDEAGLAGYPGFGGVAFPGHTSEEESEGRVEEGGWP